jgi:hypothetical protein
MAYMMQLFKIMKDHKNPKVLSEGLSWMVTALDDFGIGHVPLKVRSIIFFSLDMCSVRCFLNQLAGCFHQIIILLILIISSFYHD